MTRETRIGLLVGLTFIVMFGLVLSGLTGTKSLPAGPAGVALKKTQGEDWAPPIVPPVPVEPEPVSLSASEVERAGGAPAGPGLVRSELVPPTPDTESGLVLAQMQREQQAPAVAEPQPRTYTVAANDSLRKIARKVYGPENEKEYQRIFEANRNVLGDRAVIHPGQVLVIPPLDGPGSLARVAAADSTGPDSRTRYVEMDMDQLGSRFGAEAAQGTPPPGRTYVVRKGDSLTGIARQMLNDGSRSAVVRIYNANREKLSSPNVLPVGVELQIPG